MAFKAGLTEHAVDRQGPSLWFDALQVSASPCNAWRISNISTTYVHEIGLDVDAVRQAC